MSTPSPSVTRSGNTSSGSNSVVRYGVPGVAIAAISLFSLFKYRRIIQRRDAAAVKLGASVAAAAGRASNVLRFHKYHGTGNDFVIVDLFDAATAATVAAAGEPAALAQRVLHRHFGVGGDGLIRVVPHPTADAEMVIHNADGSYAEMCGNGLRAMAKYVHDIHKRGVDRLVLATGAGIKYATITERDANGDATMIRLDMGEPKLKPSEIPYIHDHTSAAPSYRTPHAVFVDYNRVALSDSSALPGGFVLNQVVKIREREFKFSSVSTGVPHTVIYVDDVANFPVAKFGAAIEQYRHYWPRGTNVEFVEIKSRSHVIQRTWERGCGETLSCGTGACAVAVIGVLTGRTDPKVNIQLNGGTLICEWNGAPLLASPAASAASGTGSPSVIMTGPAISVYSGTITL